MRAPPLTTLLVAILTTTAAGFVLSAMDAIGKHLSENLNVFEAVWARYTVRAVVVTLLLYRKSGFHFLHTRKPRLQLIRAISLFMATLLMYKSVTLVTLAEATAIQFLAPVLVTLWSALFLSEKLGLHRILAVLVGFAGVTVVVAPGFKPDQTALLLPLGVAFLISGYFIFTRMLADREEHDCTQFSTTAVGAVVLTVAAPFFFEVPGLVDGTLMLVIGAVGALGHYLLIRAFALAPASLLSPFLYSQVLGATLISLLWFKDPVSINMAIGTTVLVCSGIYIWWRENRLQLETARRLAAAEGKGGI